MAAQQRFCIHAKQQTKQQQKTGEQMHHNEIELAIRFEFVHGTFER
jgi:hypothetical protein